ncbi:MAG: response regulator [Lewinellaceae bacterium]|nr:response regulator [Lewinellaceae bacterium]
MHHTSTFRLRAFRLLLAALLAIAIPLMAPGQPPYPDPADWQVESLPVEDEMGSNGIKAVVEDGRGFLWLATNNGITRYDGYTFKNYPAITGDSTSLNHSRTGAAFVDHQGVLWVGTRVGINRYIPECDCFKQYNPRDEAPNSVPAGEVNAIAEDRNNHMWVASQHGGLYRYDRQKDRFERFLYRPEDPEDISNDQARALLCDRDGYLWIGTGEPFVPSITGGGLIRFHSETGEAKRYLYDPKNKYSLIDNRVSALLQDSKGRIWVGSCDSGLHLYDPRNDRFNRMEPGNSEAYARPAGMAPWTSCPHIRILHEDRWGGLWVGNFNGGLYRFDVENGTSRLFAHDPENPNGLVNNLVWSFFEDSQGRFWLGNMAGGGYKIDPWQKKFQVHFPGERVSAVFEPSSEPGVLWLGIWEKGVYRWDRKTGNYQHFHQTSPAAGGPPSDVIYRFFEDSEKNLWLATEKGLSLYNRKTQRFAHFPITTAGGEKVGILAIHEDRQGILWLGSWGQGVYVFDRSSGAYEHYALPYIEGKEGNTYNQSIYAVHEDALGRLWLGTWMEGLYHFDRATNTFTRHLDGVGVRTIYEHEPGQFWLGTGDDGLIEYVPEKGILRSFNTTNGLSGNKVFAIVEDQAGLLWLSTNQGICSFDPQAEAFVRFYKKDGLPSLGFNDFSALKDSDGNFYFGSLEGLVSFKPEQVSGNPVPPTMNIQDIMIFDRSYRRGEVDSSNTRLPGLPERLELRYNQNELTFEYVGLHYTAPEFNQYRHRLIPYEQQWVEAGTKRTARYTNLSPGHYQFQVIASNSDGLWTEIPATIDIRIRPPWWATWWAYLLYVLAASSALYGVYRFQKRRWELQASLQRELEESQRLKELDEFKSRFYANITHEFRTPLTVIEGLAGQIRDNPRWKVTAHTNLIQQNSQKLLQLINQLLGLSRLEAGKMQPEYIQGDIVKYLGFLVESFHSLAISRKISISFYSHTNSLIMDYDPEKCQQVLSNLISNAIKFTPEYGKVSVVAKALSGRGEKWLEVSVQDTGTGISTQQLPYIFERFYQADDSAVQKREGAGLGLSIVKEFLSLMGGSIAAQSEVGKGTRFTFRLPVRNEAEMEAAGQAPMQVTAAATAPLLANNSLKAGTTTNAPSVLIVEDNFDVIYYLRECLAGRYQVLEARNGREGVAKALETVPDLVVSDVMMPEMDGFEFCRILKTDERTSHIPVILLTAKATQEDKLLGLSHGADAYLMKPFHKEELLVRLEQLLELRRKLQQKYQAPDSAGPEPEDAFLRKVREIIEAHLEEPDFSVEQLSRKAGMSRVQVHRKMKALTGVAASHYIKTIRLNRAFELLKDPELNISEVAYRVGFKDPSHFSRAFSQQFGVAPSELRE